MNNYRNQWKAISVPFRTISAGYDRKFRISNKVFSGGIYIVNDNSGAISLDVNKIYLSAGYKHNYNGHDFYFGIQPGFVLKSYTTENLTFPDQFNMSTGYFDNSLNSNETNLDQNLSYFDINIGAAWSKNYQKFTPFVGLSVFHLNFPKETYLPDNNKLPARIALYGGGSYSITDRVFFEPHLLYMRHKRATEFLLGGNFGYKLPENQYKIKAIYAGPLYRDGLNFRTDALIGIIGIRIYKFDIGFSYDMNISDLHTSTTVKGAFEFSLIYIGSISPLSKITIPCDRY
ncbi:MAG: hypothetical protein Kow0068_00950 [Marinilabiliales bacterium]